MLRLYFVSLTLVTHDIDISTYYSVFKTEAKTSQTSKKASVD